jgi:excisionase family DNA binding protein
MRNALHLSETSATATKSNKTAELASLGRPPVVPMKCLAPVSPFPVSSSSESLTDRSDDLPWNVSRAAQFLGVSPQTVYLWVERKQIPHLRIMGRNIRFLRTDLERFRMTFHQETEEARNR